MPAVIDVEIDPTKASAGIQKVGAALDKLGEAGQKAGEEAGEAIGKGISDGADDLEAGLGAKFEKLESSIGTIKDLIGFEFIKEGMERIEGAIEVYVRLSDKYTEMTNAALKFADASHSVDAVIDEQIALAHDLHGSLDATREVYDKVREGSTELGLTNKEQVDLTRVLGIEVGLANKPLEAASGLMERFSYAMVTGAADSRTLTMMMREVPGIAELWSHHFHMLPNQIAAAAASGKISMRELVDTLLAGHDEAIEKWSKHKQTIEGWRNEVSQSMDLARARGESWTDAMQSGFDAANGKIVDNRTETEKAAAAITDLAEQTLNGRGAFQEMGDAMHDAAGKAGNDLVAVIGEVRELGTILKNELGNDAWSGLAPGGKTGLLAYLPAGTEAAMKHAAAVGEARVKLADLNAAEAANAITGEAYRKEWEALTTTINGKLPETYKLFHQIKDPETQFAQATKSLNVLLDQGRISLREYTAELEKLVASAPKAALGMTNVEALARRHGGAAPMLDLGGSYEAARADYEKPEADPEAKRASELYKSIAAPAEKYADELREIQELHRHGKLDGEAYDRVVDNLKDRYTKIKTPAEEYKDKVEDLAKEWDTGLISAEAYDQALLKLRVDSGMGTMLDGFRQGWANIRKEMTDTAKLAESTLTDAFHSVEDAIVHLFETGTIDFNKLDQQLEQLLAKLLVKQLEASIIGAATGTPLPGFATGGEYTVGGYGGTDSQLVAFRATPGETFSIKRPDQRAADAAGGGGDVRVINVADMRQAALAAMNTREGEKLVMNHVVKNSGTIRGHIDKR